jgi:putative ABC transport system permease protein
MTPLPAIVSDSFVASTGAGVGAETLISINGINVPIVVRGTFRLFPTTTTADGPVLVMNRDWLTRWLGMAGINSPPPLADELWVQLKPGANVAAVSAALTEEPFGFDQVVSRKQAFDENSKNPLIAASGTGILVVAFLAILALVVVALLASLLAALGRRRVELAVVRALGLSQRQLLAMLAVEYTMVFAVGVAAGVALGLFISDRMLSFLNVTETGTHVEPPFILHTEWLLVGVGVLVVLAVFGGALAFSARLTARIADARSLRGE